MTALFGEPLKIYKETQIDPYNSVDFPNEINEIKKVINRISKKKESKLWSRYSWTSWKRCFRLGAKKR